MYIHWWSQELLHQDTYIHVVEHLTCLILRTSLGPCLVDGLFRNPSMYCLVYYTLHVYYNGYMYGHNIILECVPHNYAIHPCIIVLLNKCYNLSLIVTGAGYFHLHSYYTHSASLHPDGWTRSATFGLLWGQLPATSHLWHCVCDMPHMPQCRTTAPKIL